MKAELDPKQIEQKSVAVLLTLQAGACSFKHEWADENHKNCGFNCFSLRNYLMKEEKNCIES
jgi:hypothetical protein